MTQLKTCIFCTFGDHNQFYSPIPSSWNGTALGIAASLCPLQAPPAPASSGSKVLFIAVITVGVVLAIAAVALVVCVLKRSGYLNVAEDLAGSILHEGLEDALEDAKDDAKDYVEERAKDYVKDRAKDFMEEHDPEMADIL